VAGKLAATDQSALADQFLAFMVSDAFQSVIPTTNWMYPAAPLKAGLPEGFDAYRPAKSIVLTSADALAVRDEALAEWQTALSR
jgi:thiamine transport system substrate-binding protein